MSLRTILVLAALVGASGVILGAYHAHGLEKRLLGSGLAEEEVQRRVDSGDVGVRYQMVHAVALLVLGLLAERRRTAWLTATVIGFLLGMLLFCGGLYMIAFNAPDPLQYWAIVPAGGLTLILGWIFLGLHALRMPTA